MTIRYLGHSSFLLVSDGGVRMVTDPFGDVGLSFPHVSADGVTISHGHYDHCNVQAVGGSPKVFDRAGEFSLGDIKITALDRSHDECEGKKRGRNLVFLFDFSSIRICHAGDLGENFSEALCKKICPIDVLLIPVGGNYTINALQAKQFVDAILPKIVIPMHYFVNGLKVDIAPPDEFLKQFPQTETRTGEIDLTAELKTEKLQDRGNPKIILMERSLSWK